jgi:hypothetical protein
LITISNPFETEEREYGRVYALLPTNRDNGALKYVGSYKLTNTPKDINYFGSCLDPRFLADRSMGKLKFVWLTEPMKLVRARNIERLVLSFYDAMHNLGFYNSSNGGGAGVDSSFRLEDSELKSITDIIEGKVVEQESIQPTTSEYLSDASDMELLANKVKTGFFPAIEVAVSMVVLLKKTQPRYHEYDKKHLAELNDFFARPEEGRKYITPIIIVVNDKTGEPEELVEGNHRVKLAHDHKWVTLPAVLLKRSLFKNKRTNLIHFGNAMNDKKFIAAGNSVEDLEKRIKFIGEALPELKGTSRKFKTVAVEQLGRLWSEASIRYRCDLYEAKRKEDKLKADINFVHYSNKDLLAYGRGLKYDHPNAAIETQSLDKITNSGLGGIMVLMMKGNKKRGIILCHYPSATSFTKQHKHIEIFNEVCKYHDLEGKLELLFLDPFNKGKILNEPPSRKK